MKPVDFLKDLLQKHIHNNLAAASLYYAKVQEAAGNYEDATDLYLLHFLELREREKLLPKNSKEV